MRTTILITAIVVSVIAAGNAHAAVTENFMFLPGQSSVIQTGGMAGTGKTYQITGQLQLTVDFTEMTASFDWVDAIATDSLSLEAISLDQLFFMTQLVGTVVNAATIEFTAPSLPPCSDYRLTLTRAGDLIHITGGYCDCFPDGYCYEIDALAEKVSSGWTYQYADDFTTSRAQIDSYIHSVFWPGQAFPPPEPYLHYYANPAGDRAIVFMDYLGQPAHLGYCFPIDTPQPHRIVEGILKIDVEFPENAYVSQSPPGYLMYSLSADGHNWSTPEQLNAGQNQIPLKSIQGTCYVIFLGTRAAIDNLSVHLSSPPATIYVPAQYPTIQDAINAAADYDVIEVAPGTYTGPGNCDIQFLGKAITLTSRAGPDTTIIDCQTDFTPGGPAAGTQHRGFYFHQAESPRSVLRGFTITNGGIRGSEIPPDNMRWTMSPAHPIGAGIYCEFSSPTIVDCIVTNCATELGAGIGCVGGAPTIADCLVENCTAGGFGPAESGGAGAAIGIIRQADVKITNCIFRNNKLYHNGLGAAAYLRRAAAAFANCQFNANGPFTTDGFMFAGAAYASDPQTVLSLRNCILSDNAAVAGAAVYAQAGDPIIDCNGLDCQTCHVTLTNCTVANNRVIEGPWARPVGDAAIQSDAANIRIKNSIVWYNQGLQIHLTDPPQNPVTYSDVQGGYPGPGNIDDPPLFAPVAIPDYHLQSLYGRFYPPTGQWVIDPAHSPCIDAGDPNCPVANEPLPNGDRINMGAYGGTREASKGHARIVYHVDAINGDDANDGLTKQTAFATIQAGIDAADHADVVMVWPAVYVEDVAFLGKAITVQSAADAAVVKARSDYAFSFFAAETKNAVLRNFVITDSPYGIYCDNGARPTLKNLTVAGNGFGIAVWPGADPNISQCILWDNEIGDLFSDMASTGAAYTCIQRPLPDDAGPGNFSDDPLFADPNNADYHLQSTLGRYWPQHNIWVLDEALSPCIDAGNPNEYPGRERMPNGGRLNIGAYGGTPFASMSKWPLAADTDFNGTINWKDFAVLADTWLDTLPWAPVNAARPDIILPMNGKPMPPPM
ncbi:MAG: right-handed parallel beta-helix repeat-containing protein [Sedimentisphaerales bacterium]|nr:right-handed parallel beta-helix repeat-containing protein [Sedimentisphaerales bacterium]